MHDRETRRLLGLSQAFEALHLARVAVTRAGHALTAEDQDLESDLDKIDRALKLMGATFAQRGGL